MIVAFSAPLSIPLWSPISRFFSDDAVMSLSTHLLVTFSVCISLTLSLSSYVIFGPISGGGASVRRFGGEVKGGYLLRECRGMVYVEPGIGGSMLLLVSHHFYLCCMVSLLPLLSQIFSSPSFHFLESHGREGFSTNRRRLFSFFFSPWWCGMFVLILGKDVQTMMMTMMIKFFVHQTKVMFW